MEIKTKQRLIGTVIILVILLILIPLLFSNSKQTNLESMNESSPPTINTETNVEQLPLASNEPAPVINEQPSTEQPSVELPPNNIEPPVNTETEPSANTEIKTQETAPVSIPATDQQVVGHNNPSETVLPSVDNVTKSTALAKTANTVNSTIEQAAKDTANVNNLSGAKPSVTSTKTWVIQLATFAKKNNATQLINKLNRAGFKTNLKEVSTLGNKTYLVFVGHNYSYGKALKTAATLEKKYNLKGMVVQKRV